MIRCREHARKAQSSLFCFVLGPLDRAQSAKTFNRLNKEKQEHLLKSARELRMSLIVDCFFPLPQSFHLSLRKIAHPIPLTMDDISDLDTPPDSFRRRRGSDDDEDDDHRALSITCPAGHELSPFTTTHGRYNCDECRTAIPSADLAHSCRACDYDICWACYATKVRTAKESRGPKPESKGLEELAAPPSALVDRLTRFYQKHCPAKVPTAALTLRVYYRREEELFRALVKKYGPE